MNWKHKLVEEIVKKSEEELRAQYAAAGYPRKPGTVARVLGKLRKAGISRKKTVATYAVSRSSRGKRPKTRFPKDFSK